jgi:hypothetical protein
VHVLIYTRVSFTYSFEVISSSFVLTSIDIHLSSFAFISIHLSNYSLHVIVLSSITKKEEIVHI